MSVLKKVLGERLAETVAAERVTGSRRGGFVEGAETPSGMPGGGCCGEPPAKTEANADPAGRHPAAGFGCCGEPAAEAPAEDSAAGSRGCCG